MATKGTSAFELIALICDDACVGGSGKLDISGVFHDLQAPGFPARQERMVFVAILQWTRDTSGRLPFRVDLLGPDAQSVFTIEGHTDVPQRPEQAAPAKTQLVLPLEKVVFPVAGVYRFRVEAGGHHRDGPVLHVSRTEIAP